MTDGANNSEIIISSPYYVLVFCSVLTPNVFYNILITTLWPQVCPPMLGKNGLVTSVVIVHGDQLTTWTIQGPGTVTGDGH